MAAFVLSDAHALGVIAIGTKGRGARRTDPFVAALMAPLLFLETLAQGFHQLVKAPQRLNLGAFFGGQMLFRHLAQPVLRQVDRVHHILRGDLFQTLKRMGKGAVEPV